MSKNNPVDSFNREVGTQQFVVPFSSRITETKSGPLTILDIPAWSIDHKEVDNISAQLSNVFGEMTERDVDEIIERCIDICRFRYISEHMKPFDSKKHKDIYER
jgi:hypothetical protein